VIAIRRAGAGDAAAIGAVYVAAWRSAYPGILPDRYLARLSVVRQAAYFDAMIRGGSRVFVAAVTNPMPGGPRIVGFASAGLGGRGPSIAGKRPGDGEIETLYVLDDYREQGLGRDLLLAAGASLAEAGCRSVYLWVLRENPSRWFYARLGGKAVAHAKVRVGGEALEQTAFVWDPIERLLAARSPAG
jgi:ribosomal protein S18 acetylase RimI-like enzyme